MSDTQNRSDHAPIAAGDCAERNKALSLRETPTLRGFARPAASADGRSHREGAKGASLARGVRNRNPLNIRFAQANDWQGKLTADENTDDGCAFEQFEDAVFGLRAAIRLIRKHHRHGATTIRRLATIWAPPGENPHLDAYIRTVARHAAIDADTALDLSRDAHLRPVLLGMIRAENGTQPYDDTTIDTALALAAGPRVAV